MTLSDILLHRVTWALGAAVIALVGAYFAFSREVTRDVHLIKGQLIMILQHFQQIHKLSEKHAVLDKEHDKTKADLDAAWRELRRLKLQGGSNGTGNHQPATE